MLALLLATAGAGAQTGSPDAQQSSRERLQQRYRPSKGTGDLGEALRKLRSDRPDERLDGARMLAASDDPKSLEHLLTVATDTDMRVRIKAIDELGTRRAIGDPRSTRPICDFLSRELDPSTRGTAIFALGEIGDEKALAVLTKLANNPTDPITSRLAEEARRKITNRAPPTVEIPSLAEDPTAIRR
jgi:HEAT repeat protein